MARPIKETPTLYGADARRVDYIINHPKPVSDEFIKEMLEAYNYIKSITVIRD